MKRIGFIGLGIMGLPMAKNILNKMNQQVLGYDVDQIALDSFEVAGGVVVKEVSEIFTVCDVIFTCLPSHEVIINTIEGAINEAQQGTIVIDLSSTAPSLIEKLNKKALRAKIDLLDSPVSGGEPGAIAGTLAIMTGGRKEAFDKVTHLLDSIGKPIYTGDSGTGSVTKLVNNIIAGANLVALAEGYAFAAKAGLDLEVVFEATRNGFIGGPMYEEKIPKLIARDYMPGARVAVHRKDIMNAKEFSHQMGIDLPLTDVVLNVMDWMNDNGKINLDQIAMVKYFEEKMKVIVGE